MLFHCAKRLTLVGQGSQDIEEKVSHMAEPLDNLPKAQLVQKCQSLQIESTGKKAELVSRLKELLGPNTTVITVPLDSKHF